MPRRWCPSSTITDRSARRPRRRAARSARRRRCVPPTRAASATRSSSSTSTAGGQEPAVPPRGLGAARVVGDERVAVTGAEVPQADQPAVGQRHQALEGHRRPAEWGAGLGAAPRERVGDPHDDRALRWRGLGRAVVVERAQRGSAAPGDGGQLAAAVVGHLHDEAVDHRVAAAGQDVEVDDVGAAGGEVAGEGGEVARSVGQLHPELVSSHDPCVSRRSHAVYSEPCASTVACGSTLRVDRANRTCRGSFARRDSQRRGRATRRARRRR